MFGKKVKTIIKVDGMSCSHCANKVVNAISNIDGVSKVKVDLDSKLVTIISKSSLDIKQVQDKITDLDYKFLGVVE